MSQNLNLVMVLFSDPFQKWLGCGQHSTAETTSQIDLKLSEPP